MVHKENVCASWSHRLQLKGMYFYCFWRVVTGRKIPKGPCHHIVFVGCPSVVWFLFFSAVWVWLHFPHPSSPFDLPVTCLAVKARTGGGLQVLPPVVTEIAQQVEKSSSCPCATSLAWCVFVFLLEPLLAGVFMLNLDVFLRRKTLFERAKSPLCATWGCLQELMQRNK